MAEIPIVRSPMRPARKGEAPTLEWARWVESTLRRIIDIPGPRRNPTLGSPPRPFKIYAAKNGSSCRVHVWRGACTANSWSWNDATAWGVTIEIVPTIGSGALISPSVAIGSGGAGYLALSPSTTYGIWLMVGADNNFGPASTSNPIQGLFPNGAAVHLQRFDFIDARVASSSTYINPEDAPDMGLSAATVDTKDLAIYLGKVAVDANGIGSITQYRESDVCLHSPLLTCPVIVSVDADNSISIGDDGAAYYDAP